jgi:hypothetical protein
MNANTTLSPKFLADLADIHATLRAPPLSAAFLSDLEQVHATLPTPSDANLEFLAKRFDEWRRATQQFVRTHLTELDKDDPLKCPISLFRTMDYGRLETAHTRALAWLLDPHGEHGFGTALLTALLRRLSGYEGYNTVRVEQVVSEFPIDVSGVKGRLDVLAEGAWEDGVRSGWVLVIEAKVDAWEGEKQLQTYETWIQSNAANREVFRVFLTPDGRAPETSSEDWESLSYLELVRIFRTVYGGLRGPPGFHFLRFYLAGVLQDVCRWPRHVGESATDPYAVMSYLKAVHDSHSGDANHDAVR